jgi:hypothetical protein
MGGLGVDVRGCGEAGWQVANDCAKKRTFMTSAAVNRSVFFEKLMDSARCQVSERCPETVRKLSSYMTDACQAFKHSDTEIAQVKA